jgi:PII-like signaling protein
VVEMKKESEAVRLRIYMGESDEYGGKHLYAYLLEKLKKEGYAGATVMRGLGGFGKTSHMHTASILRLSIDLPIILEVVDHAGKMEEFKRFLDGIGISGLITEEKVKVIAYEGKKK